MVHTMYPNMEWKLFSYIIIRNLQWLPYNYA